MSNQFKKSRIAKATAGFVGLMTGLMMVGGTASAQSITDLLAQIAALQAQLVALQANTTTTVSSGFTFTKNLSMGDNNADVKELQKVLNSDVATQVAASGVGSKGNESTYFGALTKAAVIKFQNKYASEVLTPVGLTAGTGFVGSATRAKLNMMTTSSTQTTTTTTTTTTPVVGGGLSVTAGTQPSATLAPANAARVPFTKIVLTAGASDVTVTGITVKRTGFAVDSNFAGIVLLDENGTQLGIAKTLNSEHRTTLTESVVVKAGTSRTFTIAGNMASSVQNGELASLTVEGVTTSAPVTATFPIVGATHTVNSTLSLGSVTMQRGGTDPGSSQTKEIGTADYTFSAVRVTAGSGEKVYLKSIRWNQTGSIASGDLSNLKTYVDGVAYDAVASSDGKYFSSSFGSGLLIDKGFSKDIAIKGTIVGGSLRTIDFDIAKRTDIALSGEQYGYGIIPPQTGSSVPSADTAAFSSSEDPWYDAAQVTVSSGTMTVSTDTAVAAQNIAINLADQPLGGYIVEVRGEPITVASTVFNATTTGAGVTSLTNITLVDQNGAVLAGPVNGSATTSAALSGTITFTDTVTYPVGTTKVTVKGKLGTTFATNDTVKVGTNPKANWTTVKGQTTGNSIDPTPNALLTSNTMTVKAGALNLSVSSQPTAKSVIAGATQFEFANYVLSAQQSGEDVRITSMIALLAGSASAADLTGCKLYDGTTAITTGSNVRDTMATGNNTFTFDGTGLIVAKGTSKTLALKCNVSTSASGTFILGLPSTDLTSITGVTSGQTVAEVITAAAGQTMTAATSGSYTVASDSSSAYDYRAVKAGTTGAVLGALKFTAGVQENLVLKQVALELANTASSSPADLVGQKVQLYYGATMVGEAQFGQSNPDNATSTLSSTVTIPAGETITLVIKGDLINHDANTNSASTPGNGGYGAFVGITYDGNNVGLNGNYATGVSSGANISSGTTSDVTTNGVRVFRNVPTIAVTSNGGTLAQNGDLYKFTVTNPDSTRDLVVKKFSFSIATTGAATDSFTLYGNGVAFNTSAVVCGACTRLEVAAAATSQAAIVPAGTTKTYILKAATATDTASVTETINLALKADSAYFASANLMGQLATVEAGTAGTADNIIWSPFSTTTPEATSATENNLDWTNGYGLPGFPAVGQDFAVQTFTRQN